jgi:hypothetical protein
MISSTRSCGRIALTASLATAVMGGCASDRFPSEPSAAALLTSGVVVSQLHATAGDTVAVMPFVRQLDGQPLLGVQGRMRFDPLKLRFVGQPLSGDVIVLVNDAETATGLLQVASLRAGGLPAVSGDLRFVVLRDDWTPGLSYELVEAATLDARPLHRSQPLSLAESGIAPGGTARRIRLDDWIEFMRLGDGPRLRVPGDGVIYGDASLDGTINILDAAFVANVSIGNLPLLTDANRDYVVAADVSPGNLPGLGEAGDPVPPGRNADGSFTITIVDAAEIANEGVGNNRPIPGEPIPGRTSRIARVILPALIDSSRTLYRDTVYELQGSVIVGPGATLTLQPGTRVEGDPVSRGALVVARAGNIDMRGTRLEPITFTCKGATPAPGCWGGIVVNGLALLNHRDPGTTGFCPEKFSIGSSELYGGCLVGDTTGVMQFVRIEYGGQSSGTGPVPGLALLGVGSGTDIHHVQVYGSLGDGLFISGGNVDLRYLVLNGNLGNGLHWDHGWGGNGTGGSAQFIQIQVPAHGADAVLGSNLVGNPDAGPRSEPDIYNLTAVGATGSGKGWHLRDGSGGTLRNSIVLGMPGAGFEVTGAAACAQVGAGLAFYDHNITFQGHPEYSDDVDCLDESAWAATPALLNRIVDPGLIAPFNTLTPDTRPIRGSAPETGAIAPPQNFFFDLTAMYIGALKVSSSLRNEIPWYAGWTRGWSGMVP